MADGVAQLEWSDQIIADGLNVSAHLYPPQPGLIAARGRDFHGLHGFLADSLPEGWGYLVMRKRLAQLGVRIEELTPLERLALVGEEGRGALVYSPSTTPDAEDTGLDLDMLAAESAAVLSGEDSDLIEMLAKLAGGSGGARPKVHVGFDGEGGVSVADGEVSAGHEAWIVKFPARTDPPDIGPVEMAYMAMARAAGLSVAETRLLPSSLGPGHFATRRFDRPEPGRRLHMVSLCGALEAPADRPAIGYDMFLRAAAAITRDAPSVTEAFSRMVFNILACNRDDHTRQHAFLMDQAGHWRLAPAYDLTYALGPGGEHYLDVEGEGRNPTRAHVIRLGRRHGLSDRTITETIDQTRQAVDLWRSLASETGVTTGSRREAAEAHARVWAAFDQR